MVSMKIKQVVGSILIVIIFGVLLFALVRITYKDPVELYQVAYKYAMEGKTGYSLGNLRGIDCVFRRVEDRLIIFTPDGDILATTLTPMEE